MRKKTAPQPCWRPINLRQQGCSVVLMEQKDTMEAYEAYGKRNGFYAVRKFDASDSLAM